MVRLPALAKMFHRPSRIVGLVQGDHLEHLVGWDRASSGPPQPLICQPGCAFRFLALAPAPKRPLPHPQDLCRLRHRQFSSLPPPIQLLKPHLSYLL